MPKMKFLLIQKKVFHNNASKYSFKFPFSVSNKFIYLDKLLIKMEEKYPEYGFATHKGYGTAEHANALRKYGPCPEHRDLFIRGILAGEDPPPDSHPEFDFN